MIQIDDFILFCNRTLDAMVAKTKQLSDVEINLVPDLPEANSVYQLVVHSTAACEYWVAHIVCGRPSDRVRAEEFECVGPTSDVDYAAQALRDLLEELRPELAEADSLANEAITETPLGRPWTVGAALLHAFEELAQHLGHIEITTDLIVKNR